MIADSIVALVHRRPSLANDVIDRDNALDANRVFVCCIGTVGAPMRV